MKYNNFKKRLMKIEELMIGNYVRVHSRNAKVVLIEKKLASIVGVEFLDDGGFDVYTPEEISPIELTEDILNKNGYVEDIDVAVFDRRAHIQSEDYRFGATLSCVHELQNLITTCDFDKKIEL